MGRQHRIADVLCPIDQGFNSEQQINVNHRRRHSTRSKAREGLRKGKWTSEESAYARRLTYYFKCGVLGLKKGTMLRIFLAEKLNCEPMRITKKFTGDGCIGKQIFRPCNPVKPELVLQAQQELEELEEQFIMKNNSIERMKKRKHSTNLDYSMQQVIQVVKDNDLDHLENKSPSSTITSFDKVPLHVNPIDENEESFSYSFNSVTKDIEEETNAGKLLLAFSSAVNNKTSDVCDDITTPCKKKNGNTKKFSISFCVEKEFNDEFKKPRIDSLTLYV